MCRTSVSKFTLTTNGLVTVTKSTEENLFLKLEKMIFQLGSNKKVRFDHVSANNSRIGHQYRIGQYYS